MGFWSIEATLRGSSLPLRVPHSVCILRFRRPSIRQRRRAPMMKPPSPHSSTIAPSNALEGAGTDRRPPRSPAPARVDRAEAAARKVEAALHKAGMTMSCPPSQRVPWPHTRGTRTRISSAYPRVCFVAHGFCIKKLLLNSSKKQRYLCKVVDQDIHIERRKLDRSTNFHTILAFAGHRGVQLSF